MTSMSALRDWNPRLSKHEGFSFFLFFFLRLEHRTLVKLFVLIQFLNLRQSVGVLGWGISPSQGRYPTQTHGYAIAQAVSRRLPTSAARVRVHVKSYGICGGQSGAGAGFIWVFRFPLPIFIPPTAPHSSFIVRLWYNRTVGGVPSGLASSHSRKLKLNQKLTQAQ
jgi:hypothetical protein